MGDINWRLALVLITCAAACGGGGGGGDDDGAPPVGALRARFQIVSVIDVPAEAREMILASRAEIETAGHTLSDDGSEIRWSPIPAASWIVRFGDRAAVTDGTGELAIELPADAPDTGTMAHPQEPGTALFELRRDQLVASDQTPQPIEITMRFTGPCGMNDDPSVPDPAICQTAAAGGDHDDHGDHRAPPHDHGAHPPGAHPHDGHGPGVIYSMTDPVQAKTDGALGSYPLGNQRCCRDFDGGSWDPTTWYGVLLNYQGSTCDTLISSGCCSGELGSITASVLTTVGALTPVSCRRNHKGRYCQEVSQGDVGFQAPAGTASAYLAGAARELVQPVRLGDTIDLTVHNNGCFGETLIPKVREEIYGVLTGAAFTPGLIGTLAHYSGPTTYVADQPVQYTAPRCVTSISGGEVDEYFVQADVNTLILRFELQTDGLYQLDGGSVFDPARGPEDGFWLGEPEEPTEANDFMGCPGQHLHGMHPCNGAPDPAPMGCGHGQVSPYTPGG